MTRPRNVGQLDQRIVLETQDPATIEADGGRSDAPASRIEVWAAVVYARFTPRETEQRRTAEQTIEVTIRWRADVTRDTDVIWRSATYHILTLEQLGRRCDWLTLRCARQA